MGAISLPEENLAMALSVEVAELVEHFQWLTEGQSRALPPEKLAQVREEIGDVMIYLVELADKLGIGPVEAARAKVEINRKKYPADLVKGKASKYTEYRQSDAMPIMWRRDGHPHGEARRQALLLLQVSSQRGLQAQLLLSLIHI